MHYVVRRTLRSEPRLHNARLFKKDSERRRSVGIAVAMLHPPALAYFHVLPMVALVSLIWGATRHEHWGEIVAHAVRFTVMVLVFMGVVLGFLVIADLFPWYVWVSVAAAGIIFLRYTPSKAPEQAAPQQGGG